MVAGHTADGIRQEERFTEPLARGLRWPTLLSSSQAPEDHWWSGGLVHLLGGQ
jgi:hypothetical protein